MIFAIVFFLNSAANFVFGVVLSAWLGPAEFGRYATVALAATTLGGALLAWLRLASLRFSGDQEGRHQIAASLDAGYLVVMALLYTGIGAAALAGWRFGLAPTLLALMPLLAVAFTRVDYSGAQFRAREQGAAFALLYGLRQALAFTVVLAIVYYTRDSTLTVAALAAISFIPAIAVGRALRTPGARLAHASKDHLWQFLVYAKPIVASLVLYQLISLVNRQAALDHLGADATGELSLATDVGTRLFLAFNSLPEMLLFQFALRRDRDEGRSAGEKQIGVNIVIVLALLLPLTAGYMAMLPTFEALMVPTAYRGDFARLSLELAPGLLAFCVISSALNPVFQLAKRTLPLTIAAAIALATDFALIAFGGAADSIDGLAEANTFSMGVGFVILAVMGLRNANVRPRPRDVAVVCGATLAMALAIRPLNGLASPILVAMMALALGGAGYAAAIWLFDVAGVRAFVIGRWRKRTPAVVAAPAQEALPVPATLAVIVATSGRPEIAAELIRSLFDQTRPPDRVICVGANVADIASIAPNPQVTALVGRRGLTHQRNDALEQGGAGYDTIVFFDDDFAPSRFWLERAEGFFRRHPEYACLTGDVLADGARGPGVPPAEARALVAARDADPAAADGVDPSFGPYGCNMAFRGAAIRDLRFDERLPLYGWLEDRDFGERVRAHGAYGKAAGLWGVHMGAKAGRTAGVRLGYSQVANTAYLARKGTMKASVAIRMVGGQLAANFAKSARPEAWIDRRGRLRGNLIALTHALTGRMAPERAAEL